MIFFKNDAKWEGLDPQDLEGFQHVNFVPMDTVGNADMCKSL